MAISLDNILVTSDSPGILVKGVVEPIQEGDSSIRIVNGGVAASRISDAIDSSYISGGLTAYWTLLAIFNSSNMRIGLSDTATPSSLDIGTSNRQFTEDAEDNIWIVIFYSSTNAAWDYDILDNADEDNPYLFPAATVALAGPASNRALRNAIAADDAVTVMFVDSSHPNIDVANLQYREVPEAPTAPTITAPTFDSIRITLPADPTSDSPIIRRDIQYLRPDQSIFITVEDITSPYIISNGIVELSEYEVRWRAVSAVGNGAWSPLATVTTPAAIFQTSADTDSLIQLSVNANANLGDEPLLLSDFNDTNLITSPALVLLRSNSDSNNPRIWGRGPREVTGTELLDGEFDISPSDEPINLIQFRQDGKVIMVMSKLLYMMMDHLTSVHILVLVMAVI